jgi:glycosyltransferase involved in cell wall biosynthesis
VAIRMLFFSNALDHPLTSRMHFLINFLEEKQVDAKIFDVSFYYENQSVFHCVKKIFSFPSQAIISGRTIRLPSLPLIGRNQDSLRLFLNFLYTLWSFMLARIVTRSLDYNVIVAADPVSAFIALSARKADTFFVYEDLDYFEDLKTGRIRRKFISILEKNALKRANLVVSVSEPLLRRAKQLNANCILVPNGTSLRSFPTSQTITREPTIVYAGSLDEWAGLRVVLEAFPLIKKKFPWIKMRIIGDGNERQELEAIVQNLRIQDSVYFTGRLPYEQMAKFLCTYYIGVAMFKPGNAATYSSPLKLFDYMAAGLPIIATDIGDIGKIVRNSKSGIATKWDSTNFAEAVEKIVINQNLWLTFHENGLRYVERYDWTKLFNGWLEEIVKVSKL